MKLYVEPAVQTLMNSVAKRVCQGDEMPDLVLREPPREAIERKARIKHIAKLRKK